MNKGGLGVGSASIVLIFAVLCLTVFSLITYVVASNDRVLVENEARLVTGYHNADAVAESIVDRIVAAGSIPASIDGIVIDSHWDLYLDADIVQFSVPILGKMELYVRLAFHPDSFDILSWRMYNTDDWQYDGSLNVWPGLPGIELDDPDFWFGLLDDEDLEIG